MSGDSIGKLGSVVRRSDMYFHPPRYRDYRWLETNWFTWTIPEKAMRGHVRCAFRTNMDVVESLVFVYDDPDPRARALGIRYHDLRSHVPMPVTNLDDYGLESGLRIRMTRPMAEWSLRYDGLADTVLDLHFEAMMPPVHVSETSTDSEAGATIRHGHIDQMMHVTGVARIRGQEHRVDFAAPRDHSWSPRPESSSGYGYPMSGNFDYGSFGPTGQDFTFFVQTRNDWSDLRKGHVHNAYLIDHGELLRIVSGEGRYHYAPDDWVITALEYELEDERGRTHRFQGTPRSFHRPGSGVLSVVEWRSEAGETGWGECNWHADLYELQAIGRPPQ
ncbi:MAG: hypothetical protein JRG86_18975 [Deltaproteobacteria bacterium]|jgi:hypothetical protein|nr:hypothetical protein [Deltaproteobacteria bacterium]MBW2499166.1 hypothetical protein [Deltaproteobacteria bacterium]